jgi:prefoldin subunit 5
MSIRIDVHHFFHPADEVLAALSRIEVTMSATSDKVDELTTKFNQLVTVVENVETQMDAMAAIIAELRAGSTDQATLDKLTALENSVDSVKTTLASRAAADNPNP